MEYKDPGRYIPIIFLLYSWGSLFGVPNKIPLDLGHTKLLAILLCSLLVCFSYLPYGFRI